MAPFLLLLLILSEAAPDLIVVTVDPGDDVILPCQAADSSISAVEWSRDDLKLPEYVLYNIDGDMETDDQHPSYKDRVELVDRQLKDGDVSLILKNVNINDTGTYECRVASAGSTRRKRGSLDIDSEPIRTIRLQVTKPGQKSARPKDGHSMNDVPEDGNSSPVGLLVGLAACVAGAMLLIVVGVAFVLIYERHKHRRSGWPADDDYNSLNITIHNTQKTK
ncbi:hepatitis A virus cellular receptor 2 homolog [Perca fluviatilis]|uniref:hepatitis A virus cellular receptor 2 homolog n=1 Tax=Perca fluviatilis TaxID=8168 RepID=UPI001962C743|nr:hepatitis A virus cellular receptor 2 homolog [Perca fluviatilis]